MAEAAAMENRGETGSIGKIWSRDSLAMIRFSSLSNCLHLFWQARQARLPQRSGALKRGLMEFPTLCRTRWAACLVEGV